MLPSKRKVLLSDTVGFIRNLPHTLVSAFRATLEEVQRASLILHVSDASSRLSAEQDAQVEIVLKELEAEKKPRLRVMNKVDLLDDEVAQSLMADSAQTDSRTMYVSAVDGTGLERLLERIDAMIEEDAVSRVRCASRRRKERRWRCSKPRHGFIRGSTRTARWNWKSRRRNRLFAECDSLPSSRNGGVHSVRNKRDRR